MKLISVSKLRDYHWCPALAYLRHELGIFFPPTPQMTRGTNLHSFYGSIWDCAIALRNYEDAKLNLINLVDSYRGVDMSEQELLNVGRKRLDNIWSLFGNHIENGMKYESEVSLRSKELGLSGRVDFIYRTMDGTFVGEVKTGKPSEFDALQLNTYMAMHLDSNKGFIEYTESFVKQDFSEKMHSQVMEIKKNFEEMNNTKPVRTAKCDYCDYRKYCFKV
ncbi:MAG: PD-(D/E)XK nuclease family protein [Candidatus Diapherotrites archaeon]|nr:PD-(D/E)XK nuclease family protein [Candidatus Diapherotrites archaeon]